MEFRIPDEVESFRREVSDFVSQEWRAEVNRGTYAEHVEHEERFRRKLGEKGWLGVSWPKEYWRPGPVTARTICVRPGDDISRGADVQPRPWHRRSYPHALRQRRAETGVPPPHHYWG